MSPDYITDEVKALIGMEWAPVEATHPVDASQGGRGDARDRGDRVAETGGPAIPYPFDPRIVS